MPWTKLCIFKNIFNTYYVYENAFHVFDALKDYVMLWMPSLLKLCKCYDAMNWNSWMLNFYEGQSMFKYVCMMTLGILFSGTLTKLDSPKVDVGCEIKSSTIEISLA